MRCPKHVSDLSVESKDGFAGYTCPSCDGQWLPGRWVAALKHQWPGLDADRVLMALRERSVGPTHLRCPSGCGVLSATFVQGVELDWCPQCQGVWFDAGEVRATLSGLAPIAKTRGDSGVDVLGDLLSGLFSLL